MGRKGYTKHRVETELHSDRPFPLAVELETFERHLPELLGKSLGKYVVIKAKEIIAIADDYQKALRIGYDKFGVEIPFFVDQIEEPGVSKRKSHVLLTKLQTLKHG